MKKIKFLSVFVCLMLMGLTSYAQNLKVKGHVTDQGKFPLVGVNIFEQGNETKGVITDFEGNYEISVNNKESKLVFSYIGFKRTEIVVGSQTTINVVLEDESVNLNEVVAIGYGTSTKKDLTGSVSSVKMETSPMMTVPNINPLQALQGTTPGLNIGQATSAGASPGIIIRGQNSLKASNYPLIVVDGVIFSGSLNEVNPTDISTIDILKDASAAAIYGSRSANGVIIITTKRGKTSKPVINFNVYGGVQNWTRKPDLRSGEDFIQWRRDNKKLRGYEDLSLEAILFPLELKAYNEGHQIDWFDDISQIGKVQNYQASISGKTDKTNYYISGTYLKQDGVVKNDGYEKMSIMTKIENDVTDWMTLGLNLQLNARDYSGKSPSTYFATYASPFSYKYVEGYDNLLHSFPNGSSSLPNPYIGNVGEGYRLADDLEENYNIRGVGFLSIDLPFIEGLNYRLNYTQNRVTSKRAEFVHEDAFVNTMREEDILNPSKYLNRANGYKKITTDQHWLVDNLLTYKKQYLKHKVDVLLGYTREYFMREDVKFSSSDFSSAGTSVLGYNGLSLGNMEKRGGETGYREENNIGYIGRLNYVYNNKYYLTLNFRRDGFSGFAEGHKFGNFPGASVAWNISEEKFLKENISSLDYLKLRLSYGKNGNQGIDPYETFGRIKTGTTIFGTTPFIYSSPSSLSNKALSWETTTAVNFGFNFSFLDNRISGSFDTYKSETTDQLLTRSLPIMTGYGNIRTNLAQVDNKGIEISIATKNIDHENFKWDSQINFWRNRSELVSLYGIDQDGDGVEDDDIGNKWFIGEELGVVYDFTTDGIVQTEDTEYIEKYGFDPGDVKIVDINGYDENGKLTGEPDGKITSADRSIIGYTTPNFNMNIANTLTYKNFQLYFDINFISGGNNRYLSANKYALNPGTIMPDVANWVNKEYWMPERQSNKYPRPNFQNPYGYQFTQSREFIRLQNITLSYQCPKKVTDYLKIKSLKIFTSAKNLITITDWEGLDPESGGTIGGSNPALRIFTAGANLSF